MPGEGFAPDFVAALPARRLAAGGALYVAGASEPRLLFVHGAFHGAWCFGAWMQCLDEIGIGSAALDLAGHGFLANEALPPTTTIDDYAEAIVEAASMPGRGLTVVGHSLGALAVARAAARIEFAGIVLLAPSPPGNLPGAARVAGVAPGEPVAPPAYELALQRYLGGQARAWSEHWYRLLGRESPAALNDRYTLGLAVDPAPLARKTHVVSAGLDDPARHPEGQDAAIARFYGASYRLLADAPHCLMLGPHSALALAEVLDWHRRPGGGVTPR
ncbi:hypothetical protein DRA46_01786 [Burkholderia gladioli]|nr:hypothetical protein [Burkholderia gladioli]